VPLHLDLLELEIAAALRTGRNGDAVSRYREALSQLKDVGRYANAATLHALGARAMATGSADAAAATGAAASARAALVADAPPDARASLEHELDMRLEQDVGDAR